MSFYVPPSFIKNVNSTFPKHSKNNNLVNGQLNNSVGMQTGKTLFTTQHQVAPQPTVDQVTPAKQNGDTATKADSTFVQQHHPTFTGGYIPAASEEIKSLESSGTEVWPSWKQGIIQGHKRNEAKAVNLAKTKNIDVSAWKYDLDNK